MAREWHRFLNGIWLHLSEKASHEEENPIGKAFSSMKARRIHPEPLVERLCWFVFLENQPSRSAEWVASQVGHDWRSLKDIPRRLDDFLAERCGLEALAERPLDSFRGQAEKLEGETRRIHPSAVLASDITLVPPTTLEDRSRLLRESTPTITAYLDRFRQDIRIEAGDALIWLRDHRFTYSEMTALLTATANILRTDIPEDVWSPEALKMRIFRLQNPL